MAEISKRLLPDWVGKRVQVSNPDSVWEGDLCEVGDDGLTIKHRNGSIIFVPWPHVHSVRLPEEDETD